MGEGPAIDPRAVDGWARRHGISHAEATRRLSLQDAAMKVTDTISALLGERNGGLWFDNDDRGRLKIGVVARDGKSPMERFIASGSCWAPVGLPMTRAWCPSTMGGSNCWTPTPAYPPNWPISTLGERSVLGPRGKICSGPAVRVILRQTDRATLSAVAA